MSLHPFTYHSPATLKEAADLYARHPKAQLLGGGTFLINNLKSRKKRGTPAPEHIIGLKRVKGLQEISLTGGTLSIGAMVTVSQLAEVSGMTGNLAVLKKVCAGFGTTPIRNMATVGGNLASRVGWTEFSTAFIALDAKIHLFSAQGESACPAEEFFQNKTPEAAIISKVTVPHDPKEKAAYTREQRLGDLDLPLVGVCVKIRETKGKTQDCRAVLNTGGGPAHRDQDLEAFLNGKALEPGLADQAPDNTKELTGKPADDYKRQIIAATIQRTIAVLTEKK